MNAINRQETEGSRENMWLEGKLLELAFGKVMLAVGAALLLSLLILLALWTSVPHASLLEWAAVLWSVQAWHAYQQRQFRRATPERRLDFRRWKRISALAAAASGAAWGSAILWFPVSPDDPAAMLIIFIIAGCTAFGSVSMAAIPRSAILFLGAALAPLAGWLLSFGDHISTVMGAITLLYWASMALMSRQIHAMTCRMFSSAEQNRVLVASFVHVKEQEQEAAQRDSERRYGGLFENFADSIFFVDVVEDGGFRIASVNPAGERMFGLERDAVRGKSKFDLFPTDVAARLVAHDLTCVETRQPVHYEDSLAGPEGERHFSVTHIPMFDASGKVIQIAAIACDITTQKQAEMLLKTREAEFRTLAENAVDPIYRYDRNCRRVYINPAVERLTGVPAERLLGKSPVEAIPNPSVNAINAQQAIQCVLDTGEPGALEVDFIAANGRRVVIHNALVPEFGADGTVQTVLCIGRDITAHKSIEEVLQRSETEYRTLATNLPVAVIRYDREQRRRYVNPAAERMLHGTAARLLGQLPGEGGVPALPEMIAHYRGKMDEVLQTGTARELEFVLDALPLAQQESYEVRFAPEFDADGKVNGALAIWYDITERKRMESEMRQQTQFQQTLLNAMDEVGIGLVIVENGRIGYLSNRAFGYQLGYSDAEIDAGLKLLDLIHPDDRARVMDLYQRRLTGEKVLSSYELGLVTRNGERREYETAVAVVQGSNPIRVINVVRDISVRKRMEMELAAYRENLEELVRQRTGELREREALLRALVDNLPFEFFAMDTAQTYTMQNRVSIGNYGPVVGKRIEELGLPQDVLATWREQNRVVLAGGTQHSEYEKEVAGEKRVFESLVAPVRTGEAIIGLVGVAMDITERKAAEAQIRTLNAELEQRVQERTLQLEMVNRSLGESEQRFRALAENSPDVIIRYDRACRRQYLNRAAGALAREAVENLIGETSADGMLLAPEYAEKLMNGIRTVVATANSVGIELAMAANGSEIKAYETLLVPEFGDGEEVETVLLVARDITERKRHEAVAQRLARLAESAPGFMFTSHLRPDGTIAMPYASPAIERVFGLQPGDVSESLAPLQARIHPDDRAKVAEIIQESACKLALCNAEFRVVHPENGELWVEARSMPQAQPEGGIQWHGFMVDITERRHAEVRQRELERQLQMIADNLPGAFNCYRMHADGTGHMLYANKGMYDVFGLTLDDLRDSLMPLAQRMHPDDLKPAAEKMAEASRTLSTFTGEFRVNHPDKGEIWARQITTPVYESESSMLYYGMLFDITAQKVAAQYERFRSSVMERLAENSPLVQIFEEIVRGVEQLDSAMICSILLLDSQGKHLVDGVAPSLPDFYNAAIDGLTIGEGVGSCGTAAATAQRVVVEDIATHPYWASAKGLAAQAGLRACWSQPILSASGKVLGTFAIYHREPTGPSGQDITLIENAAQMAGIAIERKHMEEELKLKEYVLEHARMGVYLIDERARFVYVNDAACRELGYSRDELLAMSAMDIDAERATEEVMEVRRKSIMEGAFTFETEHVRRDGSHVPVEIWASTLEYKGKGLGVALALNITERKQTEYALRQSEMKFRTLYDSTGDAVMLLDGKGFFDCNASALKMFGCTTLEEFCAKHPADLSPPVQPDGTDSLELANRHIAQAMQDGSHRFEWVHRRADNNESFPAEVLLSSMELDGKQVLQATVRDISERKQQEEELRKTSSFQKTLLKGISDVGIQMMVFESGRVVYAHDLEFTAQLGYSTEQMAAFPPFIDMVHPDDRARVADIHRRRMAGEEVPDVYELGVLMADGRRRELELAVSIIPETSPVRVIAIARDISERKQAELALRASEAHAQERSVLLNAIMESSPEVIVFALDLECRYLAFNSMHRQVMQAIWGKQIALGMSMLDVIGRADDRATAQRDFDRALAGESFVTESAYGDEALSREYWQTFWSPIRSADGEVTGLTCYVLNVSQRRRMENALRASERDFRSLTENMPDSVVRWDTEGRILYANPYYQQARGFSVAEMVGKRLSELFPEGDFFGFEATLAQVVSSRAGTMLQRRMPAVAGGRERIHEVSLVPEFDESGRVVSVLGIGRDMTDIYRMQETVAAREQEFRSLAENMPDNIARWDAEGRYLFVNPVHERTLEKSADELIGTLLPESHRHVQAAIRQVVASKQAIHAVRQAVPVNGVEELHDVSLVPEFDAAGEVVSVLGIGRNMTERYRMQEDLAAREQEFRTLVEQAPEPIFRYAPDGRRIYVNAAVERISGIPSDKLLEAQPSDGKLSHGGNGDKIVALIHEVCATGERAEIEVEHHGADGTVRWYNQRLAPEFGADGNVRSVLSICHDITARKLAEIQLKETLAFSEGVINAIPDLLFEVDREGRYLNIWAQKQELLAAQRDLLLGNTIDAMLSPDAAAITMSALREAEENGLCLGKTICLKLPQGVSWFELSVSKKAGSGSGDTHFLVLSRDITERMKMEEALRASEEKLRNLFSLSPLGLALTDMNGKYVEFNEAFQRICGYPEAELHALDYWTLTPRKYEAQEMEQLASLASIGRYGPYEKEYRQKDGTLVPIQLNGVKVTGADGKEYIWSIVEDISERKRIEAVLQENYAALQEAQRIGHIGSWDVDMVNDKLTWSDETFRIWEIDKEKFAATFEAFLNTVHPEDREPVSRAYNDAIVNRSLYEIEHRLLFPDGRIKHILERGEPYFDADGKPVRFVGTSLEVTERKRMEASLRESRDFLRHIMDGITDPIFVKDRRHNWIEFNDAFCNLVGQPREAMLGKSDYDFLPKEQADVFWKMDELVFTSGETNINEEAITGADGEIRHIQTKKMLVRFESGDDLLIGVIRDITERKKAEVTLLDNFHRITDLNDELERSSSALEEKAAELEMQTVELEMSKEQLQQTEEWYRSIMHSAPDGMLIVDSRGIIMQTNAQLDALFGYEGGELPGTRVEVLVPQAMQEKHIGLRTAFHSNVGVELRMAGSTRNLMGRRRDGSEFPVDVSLSRLPDMEGRVGAVCAAVRDMSERSKMEAARENALSEALRLAQMRSTFLAQMSHELRTPLNGILGYAQNLMHSGSLGEKEVAGLSIIKHSGEHLLSLINGLLDHAAIEADKFELIPGDIRLEEFLATLIGIIRVRAEQKNIAFACELEGGLPGMVRGDAQRLRQVLLNLLSNAVKFTDSGSVVLKVQQAGAARMRFEVRDSGVGIAPDELEKIFQPFEQVGEVSRRAGGSGLGLAISRKLVRLMGGDILVESRAGAGSTFWFEIDMEPVESDVAAVNVAALVEQAASQAAVPAAELFVPPRADLETLSGYVQRGSMRDVQRFADSLQEQDERYAAFVEQLRKLAKNFQTKALRGLIEHYLQDREGGQ